MLDLNRLRDQLDSFESYQVASEDRREMQRRRALAALKEVGASWQAVLEEVQAAEPRQLVARMRQRPTRTVAAPERPTPLTVTATDGSQIYPDRHVEPTYFLLNVSRIAFQYGTTEEPVLGSVPDLRFREDLDAHFDQVLASMTTEVVSALRDEMELEHLLGVARENNVDGRPLVALADGTLIRWMIRGMRNERVEEELIARYTSYLEGFRESALPLASYVSMPGTTDVVNLLRFHLGELEVEDEWLGEETPTLRGFLDRTLFEDVLEEGERSALFGSASHIIRESYPEGQAICYFYLKVPTGPRTTEIARVEMPEWVLALDGAVERVHATVLDECRKGDGYPIALAEAHERAVIRADERDAFFRLIERRLRRAGLPTTGSRKRLSKQRPRV
jgi:hypothetical protein